MRDGLYHKNFGFPIGARALFLGELKLRLSRHSQEALNSDDGIFSLQEGQVIFVEAEDIVEIEIFQGQPVKAVVRLEFSETQDICFAILTPLRGIAFCKSVWINSANDQHKTLNKRKYEQGSFHLSR